MSGETYRFGRSHGVLVGNWFNDQANQRHKSAARGWGFFGNTPDDVDNVPEDKEVYKKVNNSTKPVFGTKKMHAQRRMKDVIFRENEEFFNELKTPERRTGKARAGDGERRDQYSHIRSAGTKYHVNGAASQDALAKTDPIGQVAGSAPGYRRVRRDGSFSAKCNVDSVYEEGGDEEPMSPNTRKELAIEEKILRCVIDRVDDVKEMFDDMNVSHDGMLNYDSFKSAMQHIGVILGEADMGLLFAKLDKHGEGSISYNEFLSELKEWAKDLSKHMDEESFEKQFDEVIAKIQKKERSMESVHRQVLSTLVERQTELRSACERFDERGDYLLDYDKLNFVFRGLGIVLSEQDAVKVFERLDPDSNGLVDYRELLRAVGKKSVQNTISYKHGLALPSSRSQKRIELDKEMLSQIYRKMSDMRTSFRRYDHDNSGKLDFDEFALFLRQNGIGISHRECTRLFRMVDADNNGKVSFHEFCGALRGYVSESDAETEVTEVSNTTRSSEWSTASQKEAASERKVKAKLREVQKDLIPYLRRLGRGRPVDYSDFKVALRQLGAMLGQEDFDKVCKAIDVNGTETIMVEALQTWLDDQNPANLKLASSLPMPSEKDRRLAIDANVFAYIKAHATELVEAARRLDRDNSGKLTLPEFRHAIRVAGVRMKDQDVSSLFKQFSIINGTSLSINVLAQAMDFNLHPEKYAVVQEKEAPSTPVTVDKLHIDTRTLSKLRSMRSADAILVFRRYDTRRTGGVDFNEFKRAARELKINLGEEDLMKLYELVPPTADGTMDYKMFIDEVKRSGSPVKMQREDLVLTKILKQIDEKRKELGVIFQRYDPDHSGFVPNNMLARALRNVGMSVAKKDIDDILISVDPEESGSFAISRFFGLVKGKQSPAKEYLTNVAASPKGKRTFERPKTKLVFDPEETNMRKSGHGYYEARATPKDTNPLIPRTSRGVLTTSEGVKSWNDAKESGGEWEMHRRGSMGSMNGSNNGNVNASRANGNGIHAHEEPTRGRGARQQSPAASETGTEVSQMTDDMSVVSIMDKELQGFLVKLKLGRYAGVFEREEIDLETLADMTEEDLKELGIPLGPRRKLIKAIQQFA